MTKPELRKYPIILHWVDEEDGPGYYFAYLPDFGWSACAAPGETEQEAIENVRQLQEFVMAHYEMKGKPIPEPTPLGFLKELKLK